MVSYITDALVVVDAVSGVALAAVRADQVDALALARTGQAFVLVDAVLALQSVALVALASITTRQVDAPATALVRQAFIDIWNN